MSIATRDREAVLSEAQGTCVYCGRYSEALEIEHVIPRAQGGSDRRINLVAACQLCNSEKLARTPEEWRADREAAGLPWPPPSIDVIIRERHDAIEAIDPDAFELECEVRTKREMWEHIVADVHELRAIRRGAKTVETAAREWYARLLLGTRARLTMDEREWLREEFPAWYEGVTR